MRYLQIFTIVLFVASVLFSAWAGVQYYGNLNTDRPVLTNTEELLQISVQDPPEAMLQGLSAQDATDGDLTENIMVASVSHFLEPSTVSVKYVVFDSHNNAASLTRRVRYTDYTAPRFSLKKAPVYEVGSACDVLENIQVTDCIDGDISDRVRVLSNMVNTYSAGTYPMILEVSNSCGDTAQLTVWVHYQSKKDNVNIALKEYVTYVTQGDSFDPYEYVGAVQDQTGLILNAGNLEILGNLDTNTPGTYQLTYSYSDNKHTGQTVLTVVVVEGAA